MNARDLENSRAAVDRVAARYAEQSAKDGRPVSHDNAKAAVLTHLVKTGTVTR